MTQKLLRAATFALLCALPLQACAPYNKTPVVGTALDSMRGKEAETMARNKTGADDALAMGDLKEALRLAGKAYGDKNTPAHALRYATLLRKSGNPATALKIIGPYAENGDGSVTANANPAILNEAAACHIALGEFDQAEKLLTVSLKASAAQPQEADAENLMGIVLDEKGAHKDAEQMYRSALADWQGNPTTVMNNLALSLASQGMFDQSLEELRQALVMAPDKEEIARNIQIVSELRDSVIAKAPVSLRKKLPPRNTDPCIKPGAPKASASKKH